MMDTNVGPCGEDGDVGAVVMSRFRNSPAPEHQQLRAVVSAIMEVLREQGIPLTPTAYFGASMSPLEQQCSVDAVDGPDTTAFCTFLAIVIPKLSKAVLQFRSEKTLEVLVKLLSSQKVNASAIKPALSCLQHVLTAVDKSNWFLIAPSFNVALNFTLDARPKVRKRAHVCLADIMKNFQGSPALEKATELIAASCERCISAFDISAAGKKKKAQDAANAVEVLHMLGALRHVLPTMSSKGIAKLLLVMMKLIQLKHPLVTRLVLDVLLVFFKTLRKDIPTTEVASLLGAICSLISAGKKNVDEITTVVRVLQHGLVNLSASDPNACANALPSPFHAITELFASDHEEVAFRAAECLHTLVETCINDAMIQQGLFRIESNGKSVTSIERICASAESTLGYQYLGHWEKSLLLISCLFQRLGEASYSLLAGTVKSLSDLESLSDEDMPDRKQLHAALGAALAAMGPKKFLTLTPLNMDDSDLSTACVWLIPILKQYVVGARLSYFAEDIIPLAFRLSQRAKNYSLEGKVTSARNAEACAQSLWALFPSFCNFPVDTKDSFQMMAKSLGEALKNDVELRGIISSGLQVLIKQNKAALADLEESDDKDIEMITKAKSFYTPEIASANLSAIAAFSKNFLPLLFNLVSTSSPEKRGDLQAVIGAIASISTKATVQKFFKSVIEKLLEATKAADEKEQRCMLMDLALSLISGLDDSGLKALFAVAKPALQDNDSGVQKKGYKILAGISKEHESFLSANAYEVFEILQAGMPCCQSSAKQYRMACLQALALHLVKAEDPNSVTCTQMLLKEAILGLKEINKNTREAAYDFVIGIGRSLLEADGSGEQLIHFFTMVVGCSAVTGVAGEPSAISAAVSAISRLVYEFPYELDSEVEKYMPSALYLLRNYKSREVIKSLLGLMKVIVAKRPIDKLRVHLKDMVHAMMVWSNDSKNRFRAKVRTILEKLIRRCGFDAVSAVMPSEHAKHLANIRKRKERAEKKKQSVVEGDDDQISLRSKATTSRHSKWNHTDIFSDDEDDGGESDEDYHMRTTTRKSTLKSTVRSTKVGKSKKRLPDDMGEVDGNEPLNLLDVAMTRAALSAGPRKRKNVEESDDDDEMEFDEGGRLIVKENDGRRKRGRDDDEGEREREGEEGSKKRGGKGKKEKKGMKEGKKRAKKGNDDDEGKKRSWVYKGEEYKNKKSGGGGDVGVEGKVEPYAYWPMDPKMLNRRQGKKAVARKGLQSVFKLSKKMEGLSVNRALSSHKSMIQKKKHKSNKGKKAPK